MIYLFALIFLTIIFGLLNSKNQERRIKQLEHENKQFDLKIKTFEVKYESLKQLSHGIESKLDRNNNQLRKLKNEIKGGK